MNFLTRLFGKSQPVISFKSIVGNACISTPVRPAKEVRVEWMKRQSKEERFQQCPGMMDYASSGYIISAHTDFKIKANKAGIMMKINSFIVASDEVNKTLSPSNFNHNIVDGMYNISSEVKNNACKIPLPWGIFTKPGYSCYILPTLMHNTFDDNIIAYPGIIDSDTFHTVNFVFTVKNPGEYYIPAGTPLLHVIPFKREKIDAICEKASEKEADEYNYTLVGKAKNYYRRYLSKKKHFTMTCPYTHIHDRGNNNEH